MKKSMKKRITAITLALAAAVAALTACGGQSQDTSTSNSSSTSGADSGSSAAEASGTGTSRLDDILERGYIEVATEPYFAPQEFIDSSKEGDDRYVGCDIELAKYIAEKLGVELRIVPLEFTAVLSSVTEGKYDLAISALAYTPERAEAMNLSDGYHFDEDDYGLLVREEDIDKYPDPESLADAVVVAQSGSLQENLVNDQIPKYKEFKRVSATTDGFLMVQENKADAAATEIATAELYAAANPGLAIANNFRFEIDKSTSGTRIGIPKGEDELTAKINEIIAEVLDAGLYEKWYDEYSEYAASLGIE